MRLGCSGREGAHITQESLMRTYIVQLHLIQRPVFIADRHPFHGVQRGVRAINDFAEDCVLAVQMRLLGVCDEELGLVRIWARIGHSHHPAGVELGSEKGTSGGEKGQLVPAQTPTGRGRKG